MCEENYPNRPVEALIGYAAGGSVDLMSRAIVEEMSKSLGKRVLILNKVGASGTISTAAVAAARPDGYTLGIGPMTPITNVVHLNKTSFTKDSFEYVCQLFLNDFTVSVPASSSYKTLSDLIDALKKDPGKLTYGHSGRGTTPHLASQELFQVAGVQPLDVPYPAGDGQIVNALVGQHIDFGILSVVTVAGRPDVRVLAVFGAERHPSYPNLPSLLEAGYKINPNRGINGLFAPRGTPPVVLEKLDDACRMATSSESVRAMADKQNSTIAYEGRTSFESLIEADSMLKERMIKALNLAN